MRHLPRPGILRAAALAASLISASNLAVGAAPNTSLRLGSGEKELEQYKEYGYTAVMIGGLTGLASYDTHCPGTVAEGSALRQKIEQRRKRFQRSYQHAQELGLAVCISTDEIELPTPVFERFRKTITRSDRPSRMDFESAAFWDLYRAKYREVLSAYPRVAYVMVRTGENYAHLEEGYTGHTVVDRAVDDAYFRNMCRLIEETRKVVVDEFGRKLIWRTWDLGNNGFHANPQVYDRVLAGVTNWTGLIFAIKFTQTDFWRYNEFNPNIGRGNVAQLIEFQCAREYEGKGAFPNYMGPEHGEALHKARELGVTNVWIWDFGGGWGGPFLETDRWVRLNIETTSRLAQDPSLSPRTLAEQWAAKEFGAQAASKVADMLMLSGECIRKCFYVAPYARAHEGWLPSRNLLRDDTIRGEKAVGSEGGIKLLYEGSKTSLAEALQEKAEALALAGRLRGLFESARASIVAERGEKVYAESLTGVLYFEALAKVVCAYVRGMFLYYNWQDTGDAQQAARAEQELLTWRQAWKDYQANVPRLPAAASLYRSQNTQEDGSDVGAMADTCEAALRTLAARATK